MIATTALPRLHRLPRWKLALTAGLVLAALSAGVVALASASAPATRTVVLQIPSPSASGSVDPTATVAGTASTPTPLSAPTTVAIAAPVQPVEQGDPAEQVEPAPAAAMTSAIAKAITLPTFTTERPLKLPINARHMLVVDDTGHVLMAKDADAVVPIASLTKLMTAMVVLDAHQNPDEILSIEDADVDRLKHSASRVRVGARLTRVDAMEMALMASENRAASALARHYPGGLPAFETALQAKIRALGLTHTALTDPTGLSPANTSTAAEVAKIAIAASHYPEITRITSDKSTRVEVNGRNREVHNTNHLVGGKGWDIRLSKTGYTNEAGRCLTMRMKSGGHTLTVVLLDADGSAQRLRDAALIRKSLAKLAAA